MHPFFRWTKFRVWFPALFFVAYWIHSFCAYHFGFVILPNLQTNTIIYLCVSMGVFLVGYSMGVNGRLGSRVTGPQSAFLMNQRVLRYEPFLRVVACIGIIGLIAGLLITGAGSIEKTLEETEFVREELSYKMTPITTISMMFHIWYFIFLSMVFLGGAIRQSYPKASYAIVLFSYAGLCFQSFLSANRGNFFAVITYAAFDIFYVRGVRIRDVLWSVKWLWVRIVVVLFVLVAFSYFFFISRYRGAEGGLTSAYFSAKDMDRYGLYSWFPADQIDITAFLGLYTYCCTGYDAIDCFVQRADPFAFRPSVLIGSRTIRQFNRVLPDSLKIYELSAVTEGNKWRSQAGIALFGWPTIWGWNLAMFGYIGAVLFMFVYGLYFGSASGEFMRYANIGALIVCFAEYNILMTSYNNIGGDVMHQCARWVGICIWMSLKGKRMYFREKGYIV